MKEEFEIPKAEIPLSQLVPVKRARSKKTDRNYVSGELFTNELSEWIEDNKKNGTKKPMPKYVAECLIKITENFGHRRNFSGYTYLEDMKGEALLTCCKYLHNFDITKSNNGFAYATQIISNAFKIYLKKEKKQHDIKYNIISNESEMSTHNYQHINLHDSDEE